jgi:hypothetical protein
MPRQCYRGFRKPIFGNRFRKPVCGFGNQKPEPELADVKETDPKTETETGLLSVSETENRGLNHHLLGKPTGKPKPVF